MRSGVQDEKGSSAPHTQDQSPAMRGALRSNLCSAARVDPNREVSLQQGSVVLHVC